MIRPDLSDSLVHLTRATDLEEGGSIFQKILRDRALLGSAINIRGGFKCVCFSEAPLSILAHALSFGDIQGIRYAPFGVMVRKRWLFEQGGRPAIYQPENEYELLHEYQRFRHVRYDPLKGQDYSWEREWRIPVERLILDPAEVTVVVPTRSWEEQLEELHMKSIRSRIHAFGEDATYAAKKMPWHFIVLEDLGMVAK